MDVGRSLAGPEAALQGTADRRGKARALAIGAAALLALAQVGLWGRVEPIATYSYDLSWWAAILLFDAIACLRNGSSTMLARPRAFLALALASAVYWLLYECANLRLSNWYYVGIPPDPWTRSLGVFVSFATVLPGVLEIHAAISPSERRATGIAVPPRRSVTLAFHVAGAACLGLPLVWPRIFYPLIWGAAFLLLEPSLARVDPRSLLGRWLSGDRGPLLRMLVAGAISGGLWECWNFRSPAKWIYTVPFFDEHKLFEMPFLGFVGFVPFALGCHSFARALVAVRVIPEWDPAARRPIAVLRSRAIAAGAAGLVFSVLAIAAVNTWTVRATRATVADLPGIPRASAERLEREGIRFPEDLLEAPEAALAWIGPEQRTAWLETARLASLKQMGVRGLAWLQSADVRTVAELGRRDPETLLARLAAGSGPPPSPSRAEVRVWIRAARRAEL
jgi:hypothetical protein